MINKASDEKHPYANTRQYITNVAFARIQMLEDASDAIDQKGGILLGFIAVVIALALSGPLPNVSSPLDLLFWYVGFASLLAGFVILILCLTPKIRRLDPDVGKLLRNFWNSPFDSAQENIAASLKSAWEANSKTHSRKATLFTLALWLTVVGIGGLALDILVVRVML